jgi:hemerythrin-like metal-binding protein
MDDQHANIIELMSELRFVLANGADRKRIDKLMSDLIHSARLHFKSEEHLMAQYKFPGLAVHRAEHGRILSRLDGSAHRLHHGDPVERDELVLFMYNWFVDQVKGFDKQYGVWLNERNVF